MELPSPPPPLSWELIRSASLTLGCLKSQSWRTCRSSIPRTVWKWNRMEGWGCRSSCLLEENPPFLPPSLRCLPPPPGLSHLPRCLEGEWVQLHRAGGGSTPFPCSQPRVELQQWGRECPGGEGQLYRLTSPSSGGSAALSPSLHVKAPVLPLLLLGWGPCPPTPKQEGSV